MCTVSGRSSAEREASRAILDESLQQFADSPRLNAIYALGAIGDGYSHSIVVDVTPMENLNYVFQSDLVEIDNYDTIGINQYLTYWIMDEIGVGVRAEWWKADGVSYYQATGGINLKPIPNVTLRPEVRWQWSPAGENGNNPAGLPVDEGAIFGMDVILTF